MSSVHRRSLLKGLLSAIPAASVLKGAAKESRLLYVANPGIRNYVEYGGVGISVFDIDTGYKFVRRLPTWSVAEGQKPENVKGVVASAKPGTVYVSTINRIMALNAVNGKRLWDKTYEGGCDRLAISPDGTLLYFPQFEGPMWHVVKVDNGDVVANVEDQIRVAQYHLLARWHASLFSWTEVATALGRRYQDS